MNRYPSSGSSLSEEDSHLLKAKCLKEWQDRYCHDKHISVIGLDDKELVSIESCISDMQEKLGVSFFMATLENGIKGVAAKVCDSKISLCIHNQVRDCLDSVDFVRNLFKQLGLVAVVPGKPFPVDLCFVCC